MRYGVGVSMGHCTRQGGNRTLMVGKSHDRRSADTTGPLRIVRSSEDFSFAPSVVWDPAGIPCLPTDRYVIVEEMQHGGMGVVFRAIDRHLCREVAIKLLRRDRADSAKSVREFETEAHIMSYLSHPGITPIYDRGHSNDGRPFHVMKLIEGSTLADLLIERRLPVSRLLGIYASICETIAFAHSRGVVHLDLKPANVMVGQFGEVNVMDWGLAHCGPPSSGPESGVEVASVQDRIQGTPAYMSPEQAGGRMLDARTDVFGLGCILCELLTGVPPYDERDVRRVFKRAVSAALKPAFKRLGKCQGDASLVRLAKHCLQRDPNNRPADAVVVAKVVADYHESALSLAQSDMDRFFELSLDLFCIADFDGYFRRINANFPRLLGYAEDEILANPFLHFVHEGDRSRTIAQMSVLNRGQPVVRFRNRYRTASGEYVKLEWTAKTIESESVIFAVARDVTAEPNQDQD